jgi:hypothetical protein
MPQHKVQPRNQYKALCLLRLTIGKDADDSEMLTYQKLKPLLPMHRPNVALATGADAARRQTGKKY